VPVNQVVAEIGREGETAGESAGAAAPATAPASDQTAGDQSPAPPPVGAGSPETQVRREETAREGRAGAPAAPPQSPAPAPREEGGFAAAERQETRRDSGETALAREADAESGDALLEGRLRRFSSPLVRNIAAKEGVDLAQIEGTGTHGRVTKEDILSYVEQRKQQPKPGPRPVPAPAPASAAPAQRPTGGFSVPAYAEGDNVEIEPMSKIRQITAAHMVYSKATSAHVTTLFHIDMSKVARARNRAKDGFAKKEGTKLTYMPFIFKAVVNGLKAYKKLNASIDGTNIVYKKDINLGMAVDLGHGLIVPVIKHADQLSLVGLAKAANDLADRARSKKLKPDEAQGGTFTITNPGVFGSLFGTPVINQPQVGILGVGAVEKRPVVSTDEDGNDAIVIKTMCYFAITYDHRLVDGADADRFMIEVKKTLETDPWTELDAYM